MAVEPRQRKKIAGAGYLLDWRGTGLCPPVKSGGKVVRIKPLIGVEHIPVIHNIKGRGDFVLLAQILVEKGLSLQTATDSEGNVALFTSLNALCYQARGVNQISYGTEHMHWSTTEGWTQAQFFAAAWIWQYAEREEGIPIQTGRLRNDGFGRAAVVRRGHVSHMREAAAAGYNDRTDPGPGFDYERVARYAKYYKLHHTFVGA